MKKLALPLLVLLLLSQTTSCVPEGCSKDASGNLVCEDDSSGQAGETDDSDSETDDDSQSNGDDPVTGDDGLDGEDDVVVTPTPTPPSTDLSVWQEVADDVADSVDSIFNNDELSIRRSPASSSKGDTCHDELQGNTRFADAIGFFVEELSKKQKVQVQGIAPYYNMSSNPNSYEEVSLVSHNLCSVTSSSLSQTIKKVPGSTTIALANRFANDHNRYRELYLNGDQEALVDLKKHWGKFFGCLSYSESLSTADTSSSYSVARKYGPSGYSKPSGVKFYEDPYQDAASKLNIGMFQFTPRYSGNINPCIKQWNRDYPRCSSSSNSQSELIPLVGSSLQHFNAYCGVHKLLQTFAVQVNSSSSRNTHPSNKQGSSLKNSAQRCVTPHFYAGWAYNHFGPLQNSTGSNMYKLMSCVYSD
ncbi:MAG: hypothetical protein CME63_03070 [Halobacteriovoraceae bacterium]|nr:hypothetical protein [Halobacteriovoraceae bacterium]MBC96702.1 hypothetical protein [Halobacteriovoraceae bacterium]|tara:strand:+ start:13218 stop:14468 length:1251 start_codon:yes stop_codon:yes gene_type:complete